MNAAAIWYSTDQHEPSTPFVLELPDATSKQKLEEALLIYAAGYHTEMCRQCPESAKSSSKMCEECPDRKVTKLTVTKDTYLGLCVTGYGDADEIDSTLLFVGLPRSHEHLADQFPKRDGNSLG